MNRDPWSNHQVRFERSLPSAHPISGPWNSNPTSSYGDIAVAIICIAIAIFAVLEFVAR